MNFYLEQVLYVTTHPLLAHFVYLRYLNNRMIWAHLILHLIKIQWNLFGWLPSCSHFKRFQRQCFLYFSSECVFSLSAVPTQKQMWVFYRVPFQNAHSRCAFSPGLNSSLRFLLLRWSLNWFSCGGVRPPRLQRKEPGLIGSNKQYRLFSSPLYL